MRNPTESESPEPVERGGAQVPDHHAERNEKQSRQDEGGQAEGQHPGALAQPGESTGGKTRDPDEEPTERASHGHLRG